MIIRQLALQNFMGYRRRCELDFRGKQTIGIVGNNEAGKSTILSAITYGLYGDVPILNQETREVSLISDDSRADLLVELEVELATGEVLSLARGRTANNSPILRLDGYQGKPSELSTIIARKLALPFSDFIDLSYFVQGDIHQFMEGSKRDYFQRWAYRLRRWEKYEDAAKRHAAALEGRRIKLETEIERYGVSPEDLVDAKREVSGAAARYSEAVQREALLRTQMDALVQEVAELRRRATEEAADARGAEKEASQVDSLISSLERRSSMLKSSASSSDTCPVLREPCSRLVGRGQAKREEAKRELAVVTKELQQARERRQELTAALRRAKRAAQAEQPGAAEARALAQTKAEHSAAAAEVSKAAAMKGRAEERLVILRNQRAKVKEAKASLAEIEEDMRRVRFIQAMCGKSGIPLEVMDAELEVVEGKCNWVLERLDYPKRIRFAAYRELAGFEKVCPHCGGEAWKEGACKGCGTPRPRKRKDEPTVTVLDGSTERPFSLESGGARVLQSFAVRLACSLFRASMTGAQVRMVMLDEVFAMLDSTNRQKLMALVIGKLSSEFGLRQQLVVSHQEDVVNAVDDILHVRKRGGSSVATWA